MTSIPSILIAFRPQASHHSLLFSTFRTMVSQPPREPPASFGRNSSPQKGNSGNKAVKLRTRTSLFIKRRPSFLTENQISSKRMQVSQQVVQFSFGKDSSAGRHKPGTLGDDRT